MGESIPRLKAHTHKRVHIDLVEWHFAYSKKRRKKPNSTFKFQYDRNHFKAKGEDKSRFLPKDFQTVKVPYILLTKNSRFLHKFLLGQNLHGLKQEHEANNLMSKRNSQKKARVM